MLRISVLVLLCAFTMSLDLYHYPDRGPTDGYTKVNFYSPELKGLNYTDFPTPRCIFGDHPVVASSWIHCRGKKHDGPKSETCLTCMSPENVNATTVKLKVSLRGDFSDAAEVDYLYYKNAIVHYAVPFVGRKIGGTNITVYGDNFLSHDFYTVCSFGTIYVKAQVFNSSTILCRAPPSDIVDAPIPLKVSLNRQ